MGEVLLVGSCAGYFLALNRNDGSEIWSYDTRQDGTGTQFHGNPAVFGDKVFTGCDGSSPSHTYAFDITSGEIVWKHAGSALETDLICIGENIIGRRWNGDLLAINVDDGDRVWSLQPQDYTHRYSFDCSPAAKDGIVVFGGVDGVLYAVDGLSGEVVWALDSGGEFTTAIAIEGDNVYVGMANQDFLRVSFSKGTLLSTSRLATPPFGQPVASRDAVFVMVRRGDLVALSADLSTVLWGQPGSPRWTTNRPLLWRDMVVVGNQDGTVRGFSAGTGELVLELSLEGKIRGLGSHGDMIYIGTLTGMLYACRPEPGH